MDCSFEPIRARVPRAKFYPPAHDPANFLARQNLLKSQLKTGQRNYKLLYIEGQAGQGKSTLAVQYLAELDVPFAWYQLGPEDEDPVFLAAALLTALQERLPGLASPLLERMLIAGEASAAETETLGRVLVQELGRALAGEFILAVDDLQLLSQSPSSLALLQTLIALAPPGLRFIVISREKPPVDWEGLVAGPQGILVGNEALALDKTEVATLFNEHFQVPLSRDEVQSLHAATEGWIAGLLFAGQGLQGTPFCDIRTTTRQHLSLLLKSGAVDYFQTEIFAKLPPQLRRTLQKLSLLDEIPLPLARKLTDTPEIDEVLENLRRRNFFLRGLDDQNQVLGFHALFRELLQNQGVAELTQSEVTAVLETAGIYFVEQGDPVKALHYFLRARNFRRAESILKQTGMALLAVNRVITLRGVLQQIPEQVILQHPWLIFYAGVIRMDHDPTAAYDYLLQAREGFLVQGDELGEMFTLTQLIHYHVVIDALHNRGRSYLGRVEALFEKFRPVLDMAGLIRMAQSLAAGYCFFDYDMAKTDTYSGLALEWSEAQGPDSKTAATRAVRCYRHAFVGNWPALRAEMEKTLPYLLNPRVSAQIKLTLLIAQASWLTIEGNFAAYGRAKELLQTVMERSMVAQSVAAPFLLIYDAYLHLAQGEWNQLKEAVRRGLSLQGVGASPHHRSQFLHFHALVRAWEGDEAGMREAAEESRRLRLMVGPGRFDALNRIVLGAALVRREKYEEAGELLHEACKISIQYGDDFMLSAARLHLANMQLKAGAVEQARESLAQGLAVMKKNGYVYFFAWMPEVLRPLLEEAVRAGVETDYARKLAAERLSIAILADGCTIPLLSIRSLGALTFAMGGEERVREADLSPAQRQLLALLQSAPDRRMSQEQLQMLLWPDSSAEKSRSKFDTLLSRLRKSLEPFLHPIPVKHYLALQKGILCLENCRVDAEEFVAAAKAGLRHAQREEYVQSAIALDRAMEVWQGPYLAGLSVNEAVDAKRYELEGLYLKAVCTWAKLRAGSGQIARVVEVAMAALQLDPTYHRLVQLLYELHIKADNPVAAGNIIKNYRQQLEKEEYSQKDIEQALESLWATGP